MTRSFVSPLGQRRRTKRLLPFCFVAGALVASAIYQWHSFSDDTVSSHQRQIDDPQFSPVQFKASDSVKQKFVAASPDKDSAVHAQLAPHDKLASLAGLPMPYRLLTDANGELIISSDIRELFDFYLSAQIDANLEQLVALIEQALDAQLNGVAREQAQSILLAYLDMKRALYDYEQGQIAHPDFLSSSGFESMQARWQARERIRQDFLSPEVYEAFYQREQALDTFTMARLTILKDPSLDEAARAQAVLDLVASSPESIKQAHEKSAKLEHLQAFESSLDTQSVDGKRALNELRREHFGEEALARFERLDQARADWQRRLTQYKHEKQKISNQQGLSESDKQVALDRLKEQIFEPPERLRVSAMEAAGRA